MNKVVEYHWRFEYSTYDCKISYEDLARELGLYDGVGTLCVI